MSNTYLKKFHKVKNSWRSLIVVLRTRKFCLHMIESNLCHESEEDKNFILSNQVIVSDEWIILGVNLGYINEIIWYKTKTKTDLERAMWIDNFFRCIVLPKGAELAQFDYLFYMIEDEDSPVLVVFDQKSDFKHVVLPKIKHYLRASNIKSYSN